MSSYTLGGLRALTPEITAALGDDTVYARLAMAHLRDPFGRDAAARFYLADLLLRGRGTYRAHVRAISSAFRPEVGMIRSPHGAGYEEAAKLFLAFGQKELEAGRSPELALLLKWGLGYSRREDASRDPLPWMPLFSEHDLYCYAMTHQIMSGACDVKAWAPDRMKALFGPHDVELEDWVPRDPDVLWTWSTQGAPSPQFFGDRARLMSRSWVELQRSLRGEPPLTTDLIPVPFLKECQL